MAKTPSPLVLYVDDECILLTAGTYALNDGGFRVYGVLTSREAIIALDDISLTFAVLVTDIDLRGGLNGWEIAQYARMANPNLPVVYVSGASSHDWARCGVCDSVMLSKPYALEQLVAAVSNATTDGILPV